MLKRNDLNWWAIIAVAFVVIAVILAFVSFGLHGFVFPLAIVAALAGVVFAIFGSQRL